MKKYTIAYDLEGTVKHWTTETETGIIDTLKFFSALKGVPIDDIINISAEAVETDSLIVFLDDNPTASKEQPKQELSKEEQELIWTADFEACQRQEQGLAKFHL